MTLLQTRNLDISVARRRLIHQLELKIESCTSWALLGRNGTGKTSLLHTLAKLLPAATGEIYLEGENLAALSGKPLARRIGLLFQQGLPAMPKTVFETAMLGRYPHHQSLWKDDPEDIKVVDATTEAGFKRNSFIYDFMSSMRQKINDPLGQRAKKRKEISQR